MNHIPHKTRAGKIDGQPNPVDVHVGGRVRLRRVILGMSQEKMGAAIGLTFQQVQKYERGSNRISASRLFDLSRVLDVPVSFFFDDMPDDVAGASPYAVHSGAVSSPISMEPEEELATLRLARQIALLPERQAGAIRHLIKAMSQHPEQAD